ncbi:MAG: tRNA pseudouridine(55) synthase TruB [Cyclobacteriaceae bacterium]|jgi:tRNA pseudouridine55 synthase|nr:tRNA pseudouridine(55) synthase TruB [Cyclobacteriaceae bacterium]
METPDRVLLVNKPLEWTSFDVVNKLRYRLKQKRIGHAGTLDPLATGLLIICTGKKCKDINTFMGLEKEYTGTFVLGQTTPSYDLETQPSQPVDTSHLTPEQLIPLAARFTGAIQQVPPAHSAIKVNGTRAYTLARKGQEAGLEPRTVEVRVFEITQIELPSVSFRVVCSKGTYIRSLAHDFGQALGVGAYLSSLCRTRIGNYHLADALEIEQITP